MPECANIQALKNLAQNVLEQHPKESMSTYGRYV